MQLKSRSTDGGEILAGGGTDAAIKASMDDALGKLDINMTGGKIISSSAGIYTNMGEDCDVTVDVSFNAAINAKNCVQNDGFGTVGISGGVLTATESTVVNNGEGTFLLTGGYYSDAKGNGDEFTRPEGKMLTVVGGEGEYHDYYQLDVAVAQVGDVLYPSVQAAVDAAQPNDVVTLLSDTSEDVTIGKGLSLDLGGHTLTIPSAEGFKINPDALLAKVRILNGAIESDAENAIEVTDGTVMFGEGLSVTTTDSALWIHGDNDASVSVNGATISSTSSVHSPVSVSDSGCKLEIASGSISGTGEGMPTVSVANWAQFTVDGGEVTSAADSAVVCNNHGAAFIKGGTVSCSSAQPAAVSGADSEIDLNGGTVSSQSGYGFAAEDRGYVVIAYGTVNGGVISRGGESIVFIDDRFDGVSIINGPVVAGSDSGYGKVQVWGGTINGDVSVVGDGSWFQIKDNAAFQTNSGNGNAFDREDGKYLVKQENGYYMLSEAVAFNADTNDYYVTLQDALNDAVEGQTVKPIVDIYLGRRC